MVKAKTQPKKSEKPVKSKVQSKPPVKTEKAAPAKHGGKKVLAVFLILVILLGGGALWFFAYYNNPTKVAADAVENLITAKNLGAEGGFSFWLSNEAKEDSPISGALLSFDSSSENLPSVNSAKLQLIFNTEKVQGEPKVVIDLKNVTMRDGVLYFQIGGMMDSLNTFNYSLTEWSALEDYLPLIETVDNEWWQIDVRDIAANIGISSQEQNGVNKVYSCVVDALNRDASAEQAQLYREHPAINFVPVEQLAPDDWQTSPGGISWHNMYEITVNRDALVDYINAMSETETAKEFYSCLNQAVKAGWGVELGLDASSIDEVSADDIQLPDGLRIFAEISTFGHRLRDVYIYQSTEDYEFSGSVLIKEQEVEVSAPDEYRPISDLFEEIFELLPQDMFSDEEQAWD